MNRSIRTLCAMSFAVALTALLASSAQAQYVVGYPPVTTYYAPAPVRAYYSAPVSTYYAPTAAYYAPAAPVTSYYAPAPVVSAYYAPAPVVAAAPVVTYRPYPIRRPNRWVTAPVYGGPYVPVMPSPYVIQ